MPRARNIKPGFFVNELLGTYDPIVSLLFAGLWCLADKDGILEDRPLRIKAELFPYREKLDINGYLTVLERDGFVCRYSVDGKQYIYIENFQKHQSPHHTEKAKGYPKPSIENKGLQSKGVLTPLNNGEKKVSSRSDSLIPDSLIPDSLIPDSASKTKKPTAPATRLPADWMPSDLDIQFCKANRPDLVPQFIADEFRDYWHSIPGAKGRKLDWSATWRNWVRNQRKQGFTIASQQPKRMNGADRFNAAMDRVFGTDKELDHERDITDATERLG